MTQSTDCDDLAKLISEKRIVWVLFRGQGRASTAVPEHFQYSFRPPPSDQDILDRPLDDALDAVTDFLRSHYWYRAVLSIPRELPEASNAIQTIRSMGWPELTQEHGRVLHDLGMEAPLGIWAEREKSALVWVMPPSIEEGHLERSRW